MPTEAVARQPEGETDASEEFAKWKPALILRCQLTVEISFPGFTVRNLLALRAESVIVSKWHIAANVPLRVNGELIAWSEFEVSGNRLAIRLTEFA